MVTLHAWRRTWSVTLTTYVDEILLGVRHPAEEDRRVRTFQDADQRRAEMHHQAQGCRAGGGVRHSSGQRASSPYTPQRNTPVRWTTPMTSGSETFNDANTAVAYKNMPTATSTNDPDARGSQASSQNLPATACARQGTRCSLEVKYQEVGRDTKKVPEMFSISQDSDVVSDGDSADWHQHSPSRSRARENHDKASSKALSSAGSGVSQSLDRREKDRDVALALLEVRKAELLLAQVDARVGLSRKSRNSSQASSVRSDKRSTISSSRRSHRRRARKRAVPPRRTWGSLRDG
jgi:hypothetical protein